MKNVIYYFTGTGNTLAIARGVANAIGDTKLVPLRRAISYAGISVDAETVGIAFPVYFMNVPDIVRKFVRQVHFTGTPYIFGLATCGERPGPALFRLRELLAENGAALSAGFVFVMPENYIGPLNLMHDADRADEKFAGAAARVGEVAAAVRAKRQAPPEGRDTRLLRFGGDLMSRFATKYYKVPRRLHATERCNRCGTCGKICPTRNITVTDEGVAFGEDCTQCYACIHWCPQEAIEIGGRTRGKRRYHHPGVTLKDMLEQRGE